MMKKRISALLLAAAMIAAFVMPAAAVDTAPADAAVISAEDPAVAAAEKWKAMGVLSEETVASADGVLTREELAETICAFKGVDPEPTALEALPDVFVGGDAGLDPNGEVTREQAAVALAKAFHVVEYGKPDLTYTDRLEISKWAKNYVDALEDADRSLVADGGEFMPKAVMNEGEAIVWIDTILQGDYTWYYLQMIEGGFMDTYEEYAGKLGMTGDEFLALCEIPATDMKWRQRTDLSVMRAWQLEIVPEDTLVQKVITTYDMNKYLSGEYKTPRGFISICADAKQYRTTADCYNGLRLDYDGTYFDPEETCAVIRFNLKDTDNVVIPLSPINGGDVTDAYPFGGNGFTTAKYEDGWYPSPEWKLLTFADICDGAEIYEIYPDGTQLLRGEYSAEDGRFYPIGE